MKAEVEWYNEFTAG